MSDYGYCPTSLQPDFVQDPDAVLDYEFNFAAELNGDTIDTTTTLYPDGMTEVSISNDDTTVTPFISTAGCSEGNVYRATCRITTVGGRTHDKTINVIIREQ